MTRFEFGYWLIVGGGALVLLAVAIRSTQPRRPFVRRRDHSLLDFLAHPD